MRGNKVVINVFQEIFEKYNLNHTKIVLLSGYYTGAIPALAYSNYLQSMLSPNVRLYTIIDSGLFFDPSYNTHYQS